MASSGIKRGLASTAVAALAVSGFQGASYAQPAAGNDGFYTANQIALLSQSEGVASTQGDETVRLEAGAGAGTSSVTFQYNTGNPDVWVDIATVAERNDNGFFSFEWDPSLPNGTTVDLRVIRTGTNAAGQTLVANNPAGNVLLTGDQPTVDITDGENLSYFLSGGGNFVVSLSGTSSADAGSAVVVTSPVPGVSVASNNGNVTVDEDGTWSGSFTVSGYNRAGTPDQIAFVATLGDNTDDDVEAFELQQGTLSIAAVAADNDFDSQNVSAGGTYDVTITVTDGTNPVAGIQVDSQNTGSTGVTNEAGQVTLQQRDATTDRYFTDLNGNDAFDSATEVRTDEVTTPAGDAPETDSLEATSDDGAAFDFDEYNGNFVSGNGDNTSTDEGSESELTVQILDQNGQPTSPQGDQELHYRWNFTPADGGETVQYPAEDADPDYYVNEDDDNGQYEVGLPQIDGDADGTYVLSAALTGDTINGTGNNPESGFIDYTNVLTVEAGESTLEINPGGGENGEVEADAGDSQAFTATLALESGTELPNRDIDVTYEQGNEFAPGDGTADSGLVQGNNLVQSLSLTTDESGVVSFTARDPQTADADDQGAELDNMITAATADTDESDINPDGDGDETSNADESDEVELDFTSDNSVSNLGLNDPDDGAAAGEIVTYTATVNTTAGNPVADGTEVTFTTDQGYFTEDTTVDGEEGEYDSEGQTITVETVNGVATAYLTIGQNDGFNDDGLVDADVTATSAGSSDSDDYQFDSSDPLNGSAVELVRSADQDSDNENGAQATFDTVAFEVIARDQFGNPVGGAEVDIDATGNVSVDTDDDTPAAGEVPAQENGTVITDFVDDEDVVIDANAAEDITSTVTATWNYSEAGEDDNTDFTDTATAEFYAIDYDNGVYTLTNNAGDDNTVEPGTPVVETFTAVDQFGENIENVFVQFFRTGPDTQQDGGQVAQGQTGPDGAISYTFIGTTEGQATVSTVGYEDDATGAPIDGATLTDTVTFGEDEEVNPGFDPNRRPELSLRGRNNGGKADRLFIKGSNYSRGGTINLFKTGLKNRPRVFVGQKTSNRFGNVRFRVADNNRKRFTQYRAFIRPDEGNYRRAASNRRQVR
ncbi:MSCRAMM family adhesin SdrC [Nocardioidaceae bacterium]|nr:MSCRAMM family adhesin SdrC [Nocardioidaceae bacterium]